MFFILWISVLLFSLNKHSIIMEILSKMKVSFFSCSLTVIALVDLSVIPLGILSSNIPSSPELLQLSSTCRGACGYFRTIIQGQGLQRFENTGKFWGLIGLRKLLLIFQFYGVTTFSFSSVLYDRRTFHSWKDKTQARKGEEKRVAIGRRSPQKSAIKRRPAVPQFLTLFRLFPMHYGFFTTQKLQ